MPGWPSNPPKTAWPVRSCRIRSTSGPRSGACRLAVLSRFRLLYRVSKSPRPGGRGGDAAPSSGRFPARPSAGVVLPRFVTSAGSPPGHGRTLCALHRQAPGARQELPSHQGRCSLREFIVSFGWRHIAGPRWWVGVASIYSHPKGFPLVKSCTMSMSCHRKSRYQQTWHVDRTRITASAMTLNARDSHISSTCLTLVRGSSGAIRFSLPKSLTGNIVHCDRAGRSKPDRRRESH